MFDSERIVKRAAQMALSASQSFEEAYHQHAPMDQLLDISAEGVIALVALGIEMRTLEDTLKKTNGAYTTRKKSIFEMTDVGTELRNNIPFNSEDEPPAGLMSRPLTMRRAANALAHARRDAGAFRLHEGHKLRLATKVPRTLLGKFPEMQWALHILDVRRFCEACSSNINTLLYAK